MLKINSRSLLHGVFILFLLGATFEITGGTRAEARVGGGRSSGRASGFGSRRAAPPASQPYNRNANPMGQPAASPGGGFMRGLAGGIAGGFLGSMLFGSLGHAAGGGGGGGGIGFLEILLMAGLAYFGFRWWKNRQQVATANSAPFDYAAYDRNKDQSFSQVGGGSATASPAIDTDEASDIFFKIQGAWTRRDLTSVRGLLGGEMPTLLNQDLDELKRNQRINRLENISVRGVDFTETWQESGVDYTTARFTANLLDYTVDEKTAQVLEGSDSVPVKFEEDWTFAKDRNSANWQLVGIQQVENRA